MITLKTVSDIIEALGGDEKVAELVGCQRTAVWHWRQSGDFPASTYLVLTTALAKQGRMAPISLWRMKGAVA